MPRRAQPFARTGSKETGTEHLAGVPNSAGIPNPAGATTADVPTNGVSARELPFLIEDSLSEREYRQHTAQTIAARRASLYKLLWFVRHRNFESVGTIELRQFFTYLAKGHEEAGGRWGNSQCVQPMRPVTVQTYHNHVRTFFNWLVEDGTLTVSPMRRIAPPVVRSDQIRPLSPDDINALFQAARSSYNPTRNEAILYLLLDCGLRASELCSLKVGDIDMENRRCVVLGKGNKYRVAFLGRSVTKSLRKYLRGYGGTPDAPLFIADGGTQAFEALKRRGLHTVIQKLGKAAGIQSVRCSPHTLRHTFAVEFLRGGGNIFTLKMLLGHTNLAMTNRYVMLAEADLEHQHRQFSPADRLMKGNR